MLNISIKQGRLTRDPELRRTQKGTAVATFSIAVNRDNNKDVTDFFAIVAWEKKAEFAQQYLHKGDMVIVTGKDFNRSYEDKNGVKREVHEIHADRIDFCGGKKEEKQEKFDDMTYEYDGDLPF